MSKVQIERAGGVGVADLSRRGVLARAPAWWRELAQRGGSAQAASPKASPAKPKASPAKPTARAKAPVIGWLAGTCCPGVSKPCYGVVDHLTLPEQFTGNAWRSMLEQLRTGSLDVPLRRGHDGPVLATSRTLDLVFTINPVYGLEFEARLRDTPECRKVLDEITASGWGVSIGFKRGKQWTVERDGVGTVRVINDAVLDHIAIIDGMTNRRAAYPAARCHAARSTSVACPSRLQSDSHGWAFRVLAMQAGATR